MATLKNFLTYPLSLLIFITPVISLAAPNVIVVLTDDLGFGDIYNLHQYKRDNGDGGGIAGDGIRNGLEEAFIYTPYIDRMAAEGAKLTRHYTSAPVCAPARGSLLQGRDQGHANIRDNSFDKQISNNHTLGTVMKQGGYYTACVGKWGVGGGLPYNAHPTLRGFDYFYGYMAHVHGHNHYPGNNGTVFENTTAVTTGLDHAYTTDLWTAKAKSIIQDRVNNHAATPFFLYLAYDAPHAQLQVPTQVYPAGLGTSGGLTWPLNTNSGTDNSYIHPDYTGLENAEARHATMVRRIDTAMGDILQTLRDLNVDDNTLVIFTSDNGTHNESGTGGSIAHDPRNFDSFGVLEGIKRDTWEGGIRMPTFAWWPTKIGDNNAATLGMNSVRPSAFWDWMPTIVDAAGMIPPAWSNGVSLLPELTSAGNQLDKGYLYFEYAGTRSTPDYIEFPNHRDASRGQMQVIFMDDIDGIRYKGIRTNISNHTDNFKIYNVDLDPAESKNEASTLGDLQLRMKDKVLQVRIDGDYNRGYLTSEFAPGVTVNAASTTSGLEYKAYTGNWDWVPETDYLTPVAQGESSNLDLTKRTQDDNIALEFSGYITIPFEGTYTFQMTSDSTVNTNSSGAMLWVHDAHIIDDDFNHDGSVASGTMRLKAGKHPIRVLYKHGTGAHDIDLKYSGPGIALQSIPDSAFSREGVASPIPVANPDGASSNGTTPVIIPVLVNDTDDGAPNALSIQTVGTPSFGTAVISGSGIVYTANAGQYGIDEFTYTITDGLNTATAIVTVNVQVDSSDLWYPLNETSGTAVYEAGGSLDGAHSGIADTEAAHIIGKHGYALTLDGNDDQVNLTGVTLPTGDSERTVSAWIRTLATSDAENQNIFNYGVNTNGKRFSLRLNKSTATDHVLRLEVQGGFIYGTTKVNDGQWHHVAVVVKDFNDDMVTNVNEARLYVDGVLEATANSGSQVIDTDTSSNIGQIGGAEHSTAYNFKGDIDEVHVYNSAKTDTEITALHTLESQARDAWLYRYFGSNTQAWSSDADGDNFTLEQEYALGGDPQTADGLAIEPRAVFNAVTSKLEILFNRRVAGSHDITYKVQASNDINAWTLTCSEIATTPHPTLGSDFEKATFETDQTSTQEAKQFVRIQTE